MLCFKCSEHSVWSTEPLAQYGSATVTVTRILFSAVALVQDTSHTLSRDSHTESLLLPRCGCDKNQCFLRCGRAAVIKNQCFIQCGGSGPRNESQIESGFTFTHSHIDTVTQSHRESVTALFGDIPDPVFGDILGKFWGYPRPLFGDIPKQFLGISPRSPFLGISPKFAPRPARNAEKHLGISPHVWGYPRPGFGDIPKKVREDIPKTASGISPPISLFTRAKRQNPFGDIPKKVLGISPKSVWGYPPKSPLRGQESYYIYLKIED